MKSTYESTLYGVVNFNACMLVWLCQCFNVCVPSLLNKTILSLSSNAKLSKKWTMLTMITKISDIVAGLQKLSAPKLLALRLPDRRTDHS